MRQLQKRMVMAVLGCSLLLPLEVSRAAADSALTTTSAALVEPAQAFPGTVRVKSNGTASIHIKMSEEYQDASFFIVAYNERGKEVERLSIDEDDEVIDLKVWQLPKGEYAIFLEMKHEGELRRSVSADWTVELEHDSDAPPGSIDIQEDGTIRVDVVQNRADRGEGSFYVVLRSMNSKKIVKQLPIAPQDMRIAGASLQLPAGKYEVYLEWAKNGEILRSNREIWEIKDQPAVNQTENPVIIINGQLQSFPQAPVIIKGKTFVPLRSIFEALGATVSWDGSSKTVEAMKAGSKVQLTIGSQTAFVNGKRVMLEAAPQLYNGGTTIVPLRFVSEALGAQVEWDPYSKSVMIRK